MSTCQIEKAECRKQAKQSPITAVQRFRMGEAMSVALFSSSVWKKAHDIFCFYGAADEPATERILQTALQEGKRLYLPRCAPNGQMDIVRLHHLQDVSVGRYGLQEPTGNNCVPPSAIDLAILPCLAMDQTGARLGRGCGYYDRFLTQYTGISVALCAEKRLVDQLPCEAHDQKVHTIITELRTIYVA